MDPYSIPPDVYLEVIEGRDTGLKYEIKNKTITLGRNESCDVRIRDHYVSNKHCQVVFREDHFTVMDLNSLNKTLINDEVHIQRNLDDGDIISLGQTKIRFIWPDQKALYKWYT